MRREAGYFLLRSAVYNRGRIKYFYRRRCEGLPGHYNSITVVVLSRGDNRYVVTAWPEVET